MSILLAEGNPTHRRFARQLFEQHFPESGPVREVADGASAVQMALAERPELLVVDVDLAGLHGVETARQIWAQAPDIKIIFWAESADETCIRQTSRLIPPDTVYGYLLKRASADQFVHTVRGVLIEEQCIIARDLHRAHSRASDRQTGLTDVEYEALVDIALGLTDQAIAHRRFLSRRGVTSRLHALYRKLGVDQCELETDAWGQTFNLRVLAVRLALRRGLLNRVILDDEAAQLETWLQAYRSETTT
jgi:DNA-binding NarL/FixJ family response regulator